jgi:amino acid transporter
MLILSILWAHIHVHFGNLINGINSGCTHSQDPVALRHYCVCNHLTSFALIFIPSGTLSQTYIPSAIAAILSILGIFLFICLSIYEQTTPRARETPRYLPLTNIISLSSTFILLILLTVILFSKQQSFTNTTECQSSSLNLALTTYFFIILTFTTRTLLGICFHDNVHSFCTDSMDC